MGFYFRKSIGFGPIRLNFSKSGVGISTGVKGFRISTGPRGTYLNAGRKGFYYRKKLDAKKHGVYAAPLTGAETVGIVALVFAGLVALGFIGLVALVSPLIAAGLLVALVIVSVAIFAALSSEPTESAQLQSEEAEPSQDIPDGPDQMVVVALMTFVKDSSVYVSAQLLSLN